MLPVHIPTAFRVGQRVRINEKIREANGWSDKWNDIGMDRTLGQAGTIINAGPERGFQVAVESTAQSFWYPSCALIAIVGSAPAVKNNPPKKRVRVTDGPWNAAPCPHLRWHLMGFFREKLAIQSTEFTYTNPNGVAVGGVKVAQVTVECPKCSKKMFLNAKP